MAFKHIKFNVKTAQYPFGAKKVGMLAGGTGITPMLQALHAILGTSDDETEVSRWSTRSKTSEGILAKDTLHEWEAEEPWRFKVTHVIGDFIGGGSHKKAHASHRRDCVLFVCGPDPGVQRVVRRLGDPAGPRKLG